MKRRLLVRNRTTVLMLCGLLCLAAWFFALGINGDRVFLYLERFAVFDDGRYLLASAVMLVILNTGRAVLLYLGWFYLGESISYSSRRGNSMSWLLPLVAIPSCYMLVSQYPDRFSLHLGTSALFGIATVVIMHLSTREIRSWLSRSLVLVLLVFSFQWLDLSPLLSRWGFGGGELSMAVKGLAAIAEWDWVMDAMSIGLFFIGFSGGIAAAALLVGAKIRDVQFRKIRERDREITALREESLRIRGYREIQQLVHDLRRPLTTMLGLADVMAETLPDGMELDYARHIVRTGTSMNQMIEELLKEEARQEVSVSALIGYVQSQINAFSWRHIVEFETDGAVLSQTVCVNLIRFSRALVNLIDNAYMAVKNGDRKKIKLSAVLNGDQVQFAVEDNGRGFSEKQVSAHRGFSEWGSTGIGLAFVEEVVNNHGGTMEKSNLPSGGAAVTLILPLKEKE